MVQGIGLGFRREIATEILTLEGNELAFVEVSPENWMNIGGRFRRQLFEVVEKFPLTCHGLSLSLGSPEPLDWEFLKGLKSFFTEFPVRLYSEHLSYSKCGNAHSYDLLPIPFTEEAVRHVVCRIKEVQDFLERRIAIENISYYCPVAPEMEEAEFLTRVAEESDCDLLLDVNNVYVNAFNHQYDPYEFLKKIPLERVASMHMAGHNKVSEDLIIDSHGHSIIDPVYHLFEWVIQRLKPVPVLLERDSNFENFKELIAEVETLQAIANKHWATSHVS